MPNFNYTDSMYTQIDFCRIKQTQFILTYSGCFICKSQFYYIRFAPVILFMSEFSEPITSLLIIIIIIIIIIILILSVECSPLRVSCIWGRVKHLF